MKKEKKILTGLEQRRQDLEDIGLKPTPTGQFLTVLDAKLELDLALRTQSGPAAKAFLYSVEGNHSEALQGVRADELLTAIHEDLHESRMLLIDAYEKDQPHALAGDFDEEDMAMHQTLKRRINGMEKTILDLADLRGQPQKALETLKAATLFAKEKTQQVGQSVVPDWLSPG